MKRICLTFYRAVGSSIFVALSAAAALAQSAEELEFIAAAESDGGGWYYAAGLMLVIGLGAAYYFWRRSATGNPQPKYDYSTRYTREANGSTHATVDADREPEAFRKAKKTTEKPNSTAYSAKKDGEPVTTPAMDDLNFETKAFQERMRKLQYAQLPVNGFADLSRSKDYEKLPLSSDDSLINAIEQANDEFEEDANVRELAVRVLARFRTRNSIEALSQIALYDLSANLRSKAVTSLTEFDHEVVFEAILLACADPTREVRAAAARGLFRLNFDRADAWKRIIETDDEFRMSHAARAAIEAGIVAKSFDRLVHEDYKIAYEAFALVALLIKAGETREMFETISTNKDERVRFALLHVLKVVRNERTIAPLHALLETADIPIDVAERVRDAVESFEPVRA